MLWLWMTAAGGCVPRDKGRLVSLPTRTESSTAASVPICLAWCSTTLTSMLRSTVCAVWTACAQVDMVVGPHNMWINIQAVDNPWHLEFSWNLSDTKRWAGLYTPARPRPDSIVTVQAPPQYTEPSSAFVVEVCSLHQPTCQLCFLHFFIHPSSHYMRSPHYSTIRLLFSCLSPTAAGARAVDDVEVQSAVVAISIPDARSQRAVIQHSTAAGAAGGAEAGRSAAS
jgi:hypothetical protein